jgi:hypothetical protein
MPLTANELYVTYHDSAAGRLLAPPLHSAKEPGANGAGGPGEPTPTPPLSPSQQQQQQLEAKEERDWTLLGFPTYLHNTQARPFPCQEPKEFSDSNGNGRWRRESAIWNAVRYAA